jgi:hypothetical protein
MTLGSLGEVSVQNLISFAFAEVCSERNTLNKVKPKFPTNDFGKLGFTFGIHAWPVCRSVAFGAYHEKISNRKHGAGHAGEWSRCKSC